jgi:hypothetical protein
LESKYDEEKVNAELKKGNIDNYQVTSWCGVW